MPQYAYDYCVDMIKTQCGKCIKVSGPSIRNLSKKKYDCGSPQNNKLNLDIMNESYKIHFEANSFYGFDDWFKLAFCGRNINNTEEGFQLFLKYSRLQKGYENEAEENIRKISTTGNISLILMK